MMVCLSVRHTFLKVMLANSISKCDSFTSLKLTYRKDMALWDLKSNVNEITFIEHYKYLLVNPGGGGALI